MIIGILELYRKGSDILSTLMPHVDSRKSRGTPLQPEELEAMLTQVQCAPPSIARGYRQLDQMLVKSGPCYKTDDQLLFDSSFPDEKKLETASEVLSKTPSLLHATVVTPAEDGAVVIHVHEKEQGLRIFPHDFPYLSEVAAVYDSAIARTTDIIDRCTILRGGDPRRTIPLIVEAESPSWRIAEEIAAEFIERYPDRLQHRLMRGIETKHDGKFRLSGRLSVDILNTPLYLRRISEHLATDIDHLKRLCIPPYGSVDTTTRAMWKYYGMSDSDAEKYLRRHIIPSLSKTPVAIEPTKYMYGDPLHSVLSMEITDAYSREDLGFVGLHVPHGIPKIRTRTRKTRGRLTQERIVKPIPDMNSDGAIYLGDMQGTEKSLEQLYKEGVFSCPPSLNTGLQWLLVSGIPDLMTRAVDTIASYRRGKKIDGDASYRIVRSYINQLAGLEPIQRGV